MTITIRAVRWPQNAAGMTYWCLEFNSERKAYFPLREFGRTHKDGQDCVKFARALAKERGLEFVSEVGINTED